jgi:hypothetical protein
MTLGNNVKGGQLLLPVFLPGNNRDFKEIQGLADINDEGQIIITLQHKSAGLELLKMRNDGILFACAFDYLDPTAKRT